MAFVKNDAMIKALAPYRANHSLRVRILPWRARRDHHFFDAHALNSLAKCVAVDSIAITNQKSWCLIEGKSLDDLLCRPFGCGVRGDVEVDDVTTVVAKHNEREQDPKRSGGHCEEVNGDDVLDVIVEERTPRL